MSRSLGVALPREVMAMTDGSRLAEDRGMTFTLITSGEDGWPSVALLSVGEVLAPDERSIRLALWPGSTTSGNLRTTGRGTVMFVGADVWYARLAALRGPDLIEAGIVRAFFDCRVEEVLVDSVTYATIKSGITFDLPDRAGVVARWTKTIELLRAAPGVWPADGGDDITDDGRSDPAR